MMGEDDSKIINQPAARLSQAEIWSVWRETDRTIARNINTRNIAHNAVVAVFSPQNRSGEAADSQPDRLGPDDGGSNDGPIIVDAHAIVQEAMDKGRLKYPDFFD